MQRVYLIIPVFNDRDSLRILKDELAGLNWHNRKPHLVVVDDGSMAEPTILDDLDGFPYQADLISLKRNVGHQRAIAIGLSYVVKQGDGDLVVVMDGDGEDKPDDIPGLLEALENDKTDVAVAKRRRREENQTFKFLYHLYKRFFRMLAGHAIQFGNFCVMTPRAAQRLVQMDELWMHFPATLLKSGIEISSLLVDRGKRYSGVSKMNIISLTTHGLRSIAVFTETVLTRIMLFCAAVATTSIVLIFLALLLKLMGHATPGWMTAAVGALIGLLVQTATISLLSLLISMNSRNASNLVPMNVAFDYIERVDKHPQTN